MQVIGCKNCGNSHVGFGNICVDLTFTKHVRCCESCNNIRTDSQYFYFCSLKCLKEYMIKHDLEKEINL